MDLRRIFIACISFENCHNRKSSISGAARNLDTGRNKMARKTTQEDQKPAFWDILIQRISDRMSFYLNNMQVK